MSEFYTVSGSPSTGSSGSSATIRSEFVLIETGLALLPTLSGNASKIVAINSSATALEAIATVAVAQGGTGVATLTDGGILLGSGTGAITALAVLADGEMIVGDGTTDPAIESGATLRTSIGIGTGDSITLTGLTVTGTATLATVDINAGAIDGTTVGATAASTGAFTTLTATTFGGIASANLLDKSATETVSGTYTFSSSIVGSITGTAAVATTITAADEGTDTTSFPVFVTAATGDLGAKTNSAFTFDASLEQLSSSRMRVTESGEVSLPSTTHPFQIGPSSGKNIAIDADEIMTRNNGGASTLNLNVGSGKVVCGGALEAATFGGIAQDDLLDKTATETITGTWSLDGDVTATDFGTGGKVKDGDDVLQPIGFNVMKYTAITAAQTLTLATNGQRFNRTVTTAFDVTCPDDSTLPVGATWSVTNAGASGVFRIKGATGVTVRHFDGSATTSVAAGTGFTMATGSVITVTKLDDTNYDLWGSGITTS